MGRGVGLKAQDHLQCDPAQAQSPSSPHSLNSSDWSDRDGGGHVLTPSPLLPDKIEDELEMTMVCHRPEGLEQLEAQTNFTKRELQVLYRGFKNVRHPHNTHTHTHTRPRHLEACCDFCHLPKLFPCQGPQSAEIQGGHCYEPTPGEKVSLQEDKASADRNLTHCREVPQGGMTSEEPSCLLGCFERSHTPAWIWSLSLKFTS